MASVFCGLDFGTSNSTLAVHNGTQPLLVPLEANHVTLPSAIFFDIDEDASYFGRQALTSYIDGAEGRLMRAIKSVLGTSLMEGKTDIGHRAIAFPEVIALFLRHVKQTAEARLGQPLEQVVLGRPVRFVDDDDAADRRAEDALRQIAGEIGFRDVAFQYEPLAAAMDYEQQVAREELAVIADIGGGTSDFSVIRLSPQGRRKQDRQEDILANGGVHIGGTNFDQQLSLHTVMPLLGLGTKMGDKNLDLPVSYYHDLATWHRINLLYDRKALAGLRDLQRDAQERQKVDRLVRVIDRHLGHQLAMQVEAAKIGAVEAGEARLDLDFVEPELTQTVRQEQLDSAIAADAGKVVDALRQTLADAGVGPDAIDSVFLTGGSTAIPSLRQSFLAWMPHAQVIQGDLFGSVGTGLAIDAARRFA